MIVELPFDFSDDYYYAKLEHAALCRAVKMAREQDFDNALLDKMMNARKEAEDIAAGYSRRALAAIVPAGTNIGKMRGLDGWYVFCWQGAKKKNFATPEPLLPNEIDRVLVDLKKNPIFSTCDKDKYLPLATNFELLERHKDKVCERANILLWEFAQNTPQKAVHEPQEARAAPEHMEHEDPVTLHAVDRWIQRVLGITEKPEFNTYREAHFQEVKKQVLDTFEQSELVYENDSGAWHFHKKTAMFFLVKGLKIVTLYVNDFGFTKAINKKITLEQLKLVQKLQRDYEKAKGSIKEKTDELASRIKESEERIQREREIIKELTAQKDESFFVIRQGRFELEAEENKLFTKFRARSEQF